MLVVKFQMGPMEKDVSISFYRIVRPFGLWKPIRRECGLSPRELSGRSESVFLTVVNVFLGMVAIIGLYLFPMYLVGHWYFKSVVWLGPAISAVVVLKYTWYENLPEFGVV